MPGLTRRTAFALSQAAGWALLMAGCASPGPPRPPSLNLPRPATAFVASRTGDVVSLSWMVPDTSTDDLSLARKHGGGQLQAELCRAVDRGPCVPLSRMPVSPGRPAAYTDALPQPLATGPAHLVHYRVAIRNAAGHAAGTPPEALAASGSGPEAIGALAAESRADGVHLRWTRSDPSVPIVLERDQPDGSPPGRVNPTSGGDHNRGRTALPQPATLSVKDDRGGAVDAMAPLGSVYRYTVGRVQSVSLEGHTLLVRGPVSTTTVDRRQDTFPPAVPRGLVAIEVAADGRGSKPEVTLSWEPNTEPDLQGYLVYRSEADSVRAAYRLTATPIGALNFDDFTAIPGRVYRYSISALNSSGRESARSPDVPSR